MLEAGSVNSARHYDRVAEAWGYLLGSSLHYGWFGTGSESLEQATRELTGQMLRRLDGIAPGARVLDVGCGTGAPARAIARRYRCEVTGISPSRACVGAARAAIPSGLAGLLRFELGDAQAMQFPDHSFDAAWVMESSHLMLDKRKLWSELDRVLKPDAQVVLCDVMHVRELALPEVMARRDDFLLLARVFGRAIMRTPDFYAAEARRAGFHDVVLHDLSAGTAATFVHWRANARAYRDPVTRLIGETGWSEFLASTEVLERLWRDGVLGYYLLEAARGTAASRRAAHRAQLRQPESSLAAGLLFT